MEGSGQVIAATPGESLVEVAIYHDFWNAPHGALEFHLFGRSLFLLDLRAISRLWTTGVSFFPILMFLLCSGHEGIPRGWGVRLKINIFR
jgi:hypothetical protein